MGHLLSDGTYIETSLPSSMRCDTVERAMTQHDRERFARKQRRNEIYRNTGIDIGYGYNYRAFDKIQMNHDGSWKRY